MLKETNLKNESNSIGEETVVAKKEILYWDSWIIRGFINCQFAALLQTCDKRTGVNSVLPNPVQGDLIFNTLS